MQGEFLFYKMFSNKLNYEKKLLYFKLQTFKR